MKRREFFTKAIVTALAAPVLVGLIPNVASAQEGRRKAKAGGAASDMVDPKEGTAKAVGYIEKTKIKEKTCANCQLYSNGQKNGGKEVGSCAIFPGKKVVGNGYCNSWAKKS